MENFLLRRQLTSLNRLFDLTGRVAEGDLEIQAHWAKYLCIRCAGFIENALKELYSDFVKRNAQKPVADFAQKQLKFFGNPNTEKFYTVAGSFKNQWREDLEEFINEDLQRKGSIDSIMANRNNIAHGKDSGITVSQLNQWFNKALEVIEFIERQTHR